MPTPTDPGRHASGGHPAVSQRRHAEGRALARETVFTGVFKDPVAGPRHVRKLNVDGDGQGDLAGHGGEERAVFVYQIDSYRYWERELGRATSSTDSSARTSLSKD